MQLSLILERILSEEKNLAVDVDDPHISNEDEPRVSNEDKLIAVNAPPKDFGKLQVRDVNHCEIYLNEKCYFQMNLSLAPPFANYLQIKKDEPRFPQPSDCSNSILDLCTRRAPRLPSPIISDTNLKLKNPLAYTEMPNAVAVSSPGSEVSDLSTSSDPYRDVHVKHLQTYVTTKVKIPRPFKAYPKDPLTLTGADECILSKESTEAYSEFRKKMMAQVHASQGITNKNMRRIPHGTNIHNPDDATYWEKRKKNNEAAKRSRDARRAKEDELAIRAAFLERENLHLRCELANVRMELDELRNMLYRRAVV
ncbi:hypothetical protein FQA39_LY06127 [Lamprigera yunnana]|nr:hypothetical protein FQA39_LY06127 [Lamprigera yunnana]